MKFILTSTIFLIIGVSLPAAQWTQTNGPGGGWIRAFAVSDHTLFAGNYCGVFSSEDRGLTWTRYNSGLGNDIGIITLFPSGNNLYAATQRGFYRSESIFSVERLIYQ